MRRRFIYGVIFAVLLAPIFYLIYAQYFYSAPTCFDNKQNGDEAGVDCDGSCVRICAFSIEEPTVKWARSFKVTDGQYNAVAYVENTNKIAASPAIPYTFSLYDEQGLILERSGTTVLPPDSIYPIFEGRIMVGRRVPTRTFLTLGEAEIWQPATYGRDQFTIVSRSLTGSDSKPRLEAVLYNNDVSAAKNVEVVATIFDSEGTALAASETYVDSFAPQENTKVTFTWPEPIATTLRSCEIPTDVVLAIDLSGSMNNDSENPPEPITSVKQAAERFVNRLNSKDGVGLVTFASKAILVSQLTNQTTSVATFVSALAIDPKEETGSTNTGDAITAAGEELVSERHNEDARKVLIVLTDGLATAPEEDPEQYAIDAANAVKESGVEIYAIGLGKQVKMDFIKTIASEEDHYYQALTSQEVDQIYRVITSSLCEEGAAVIDIVPKTKASFTQL